MAIINDKKAPSPAQRAAAESLQRHLRAEGHVWLGEDQPQRPAIRRPPKRKDIEMPRTPRTEIEKHIADLDAQRAAELQQRRDEDRKSVV